MTEINTHLAISKRLCGIPSVVKKGNAVVELDLTDEMAVDDSGLIHGGFIFGLADHAAMLAVNHPNVVLGSADIKFLKPARSGQKAIAKAETDSVSGKKNIIKTTVTIDQTIIFEGTLTCFILNRHVLE